MSYVHTERNARGVADPITLDEHIQGVISEKVKKVRDLILLNRIKINNKAINKSYNQLDGEDFHLTESDDLAPNKHILGLMLKNQKIHMNSEYRKRIENKLSNIDNEINLLQREEITNRPNRIINHLVIPIQAQKKQKVMMMKDDFERMQKDSDAKSFVKKIHNAINERNWRMNKKKQDLIKKVLEGAGSPVKIDDRRYNQTPSYKKQVKANPLNDFNSVELPSISKQQKFASNLSPVKSTEKKVPNVNSNDFTFKPSPVKTNNRSIRDGQNEGSHEKGNNDNIIEDDTRFNLESLSGRNNVNTGNNRNSSGQNGSYLPKILNPHERITSSSKQAKKISRSKSPVNRNKITSTHAIANSHAAQQHSNATPKQNSANYYNNGKYINIEENYIDQSFRKQTSAKSPYFFNNPKYSKFLENKNMNLKIKRHIQNNDIKYLSDTNNISEGDIEILRNINEK